MKKSLKTIIITVLALTCLLLTTQPGQLPVVVLMVPFVGFFIILTLAVALFLRRQGGAMTMRDLRIGAVAAALPVILLIMQSVGQLTVRDVLMVIAFFAVVAFYLGKRRTLAETE
jgi:hypothetical protein